LFLSVEVFHSRKDSLTIPASFTNIIRRVKGELMPLQATFEVFTIRVVLAIDLPPMLTCERVTIA